MTQPASMTAMAQAARSQLEEGHRRGLGMPFSVQFWRDGEMAASMRVEGDTDDLTFSVRVAVIGFSADVVVLSLDSYNALQDENPLTGAEWEHGEMEKSADQLIQMGAISEALTTMAYDRSGPLGLRVQLYRRVDNRLEWGAPDDADEFHPIQGYLDAALRDIMQSRRAIDGVPLEVLTAGPHSKETVLTAADMMTAELIAENLRGVVSGVSLYAQPGSVRESALAENGITSFDTPTGPQA